jgi:hypothetical protein
MEDKDIDIEQIVKDALEAGLVTDIVTGKQVKSK